ncbi:uncharacterized protein C8Q71DRAFT_794970 [Rhodofomes roseus]|uniref:Methyltransferase domain-containing protein n=1 Tax=Rhodofomes roseus TaxID=34475 RepID=A0ABQ8KT72_9APHY|nr:uncharacterized protein C8Q71DRAFT_794970 [Rhodofomes roseus]KAH9841031.1 hypothetical protein C8Q71DRAFT_794970 [Rhodofomes roseus]
MFNRLALQHNLLIQVLGNRLVMADITIGPEDQILDSGTGSGVTVYGKVIPESTVLHGVDIESGLFPREDPSVVSRGNVHFHVGSCTAMPSDWGGKFKLVNQRPMIAALRKEEWEQSFQESTLREIGYWRAGPETEKFSAMTNTASKAKGLVLDCVAHIPELLRQAGFMSISVEPTNWMAVFRGVKSSILKGGGFGHVSSEADFDVMVDRMENEWQSSPDAEIQNNVICAQKPLL